MAAKRHAPPLEKDEETKRHTAFVDHFGEPGAAAIVDVGEEFLTESSNLPEFFNLLAHTYGWRWWLENKLPNACSFDNAQPRDYAISLDAGLVATTPYFYRRLQQCEGNRFVIGTLAIFGQPDHLNGLVFDMTDRVLTRYEPDTDFQDAQRTIDDAIKAWLWPGWRYTAAFKYCPGPQALERAMPQYDWEEGYCVAWSLLLLHYRVLNPDRTDQQLVDYFADKNPSELQKMVRGYASTILAHRQQMESLARIFPAGTLVLTTQRKPAYAIGNSGFALQFDDGLHGISAQAVKATDPLYQQAGTLPNLLRHVYGQDTTVQEALGDIKDLGAFLEHGQTAMQREPVTLGQYRAMWRDFLPSTDLISDIGERLFGIDDDVTFQALEGFTWDQIKRIHGMLDDIYAAPDDETTTAFLRFLVEKDIKAVQDIKELPPDLAYMQKYLT